jgi:hypothetical protein
MTKTKFPRWIPQGAEAITREGVNAVCYLYASRSSRPAVLMYGGNRSKADSHYSYRSEQEARDAASRYLDGQAASAVYKAEQRVARNRPHTLAVGSILACSWGYDQTNVDFYEVVELHGAAFLSVRKIAQKVVENQQSSERVVACPGQYCGEPMRKRATAGNAIRIADYASAYEWDGKPKHQTAFGWGH